MGNQKLDANVIGIISANTGCLYKSEVFVGDDIVNVSLYKAVSETKKGSFFVTATKNDTLLSIKEVREDLDEQSARRMNEDLVKRIQSSCPDEVTVEAVVNEAEDAKPDEQPVMVMLSGKNDFTADEKLVKLIGNEVADWMEELKVMKSAKVSKKQAESYQLEYEKIMSVNLLPHDKEPEHDYSNAMTMVTLIFAIISIFFYEMCVFPVVAIVAGVFSAYRCYKNNNIKATIICAVCIVIGIVFTYFGWQEFRDTMFK